MKIGRKSQTAFAIAIASLVIGGAILVAARQRAEPPGPSAMHVAVAKQADATDEVAVSNNTPLDRHADMTSRPSVPPSVAEVAAPTPECLAARAAAAADRAELESMTPSQLEAAIDAAARASVDEEEEWKRAHNTCLNLSGRARNECEQSHGISAAAQSAEERADNALLVAATRQEAFRIASRGDARSLVAAAQMLPLNYPADPSNPTAAELANRHPLEAIGWLVQAQSLGRDDALVQWAVATLVPFDSKSSPAALGAAQSAARRRLMSLEPDNAAAYLLSLGEHPGQARPYSREEIARAASLPRYRTPSADLVRNALQKSVDNSKAAPTPPLRAALRRQIQGSDPRHEAAVACSSDDDLLTSMRLLMAVTPLIALGPAAPLGSCNLKDLGDTEAGRNACLSLADLVYAGGDAVEKIMAAARAREIAPAGTVRDLWEQRLRLIRWRNSHMERAYQEIDPIQVSRVFWDAWNAGAEDRATVEMLRRLGVAPEPPPEWKMPTYP